MKEAISVSLIITAKKPINNTGIALFIAQYL